MTQTMDHSECKPSKCVVLITDHFNLHTDHYFLGPTTFNPMLTKKIFLLQNVTQKAAIKHTRTVCVRNACDDGSDIKLYCWLCVFFSLEIRPFNLHRGTKVKLNLISFQQSVKHHQVSRNQKARSLGRHLRTLSRTSHENKEPPKE